MQMPFGGKWHAIVDIHQFFSLYTLKQQSSCTVEPFIRVAHI